ncbi:hypothetical protein PENSPDRAFT_509477 [Peniophora sp. CONT]|nr:hypothetical protein PENSPDRAFT_509477 [Peniophora sp. CONT]
MSDPKLLDVGPSVGTYFGPYTCGFGSRFIFWASSVGIWDRTSLETKASLSSSQLAGSVWSDGRTSPPVQRGYFLSAHRTHEGVSVGIMDRTSLQTGPPCGEFGSDIGLIFAPSVGLRIGDAAKFGPLSVGTGIGVVCELVGVLFEQPCNSFSFQLERHVQKCEMRPSIFPLAWF